jgi:4-hydroxy-3-methylbut-2-enyl diphosphate reductase
MPTTGRRPDFVVLCALPPEVLAVMAGLAAWRRRAPSAARGGRAHLVGMGPRMARRASARLASSLPDDLPVVVLGVGGALEKGFAPGDLVVATAIGTAEVARDGNLEIAGQPTWFDESSTDLANRLATSLVGQFNTRLAPILSAERTAKGPEREALGNASGAVICDTESAWLARLADRRPFAVVRSVVDTPERELMSLDTITGGILGLTRLGQAARLIAECLAAS